MFMKIIMFVFCYPMLPILYFVIKNELQPRKNIVLGITLPSEELKNPAVTAIIKQVIQQMRRIAIIFALVPFTSLFTHYDSITYSIFMMWITILCFIFFLPFILGNKKLQKLKKEREWHVDTEGITVVDLKVSLEKPNTLHILWFLPPVIISILPVIIDIMNLSDDTSRYSLISTCSFAFITILCVFLYHISYRSKQEIISTDSLINQTLTRIRRYNWGKCLIGVAYTNALYTLYFWFFFHFHQKSMFVFLAVTLLYIFFLLWWVLRAEFKVRLAQQQLFAQTNDPYIVDEDCYWIYGLFYYNPNNKRFLVEKRIGFGTTCNFAKTSTKILSIVVILTMLALPVSCVAMIQSEFSPLKLQLDEDSVTSSHLYTTYDIPFDTIESVTLWNELPDITKENGTGFHNLCKGSYSVAGNGTCTICLNPNNNSFLFLTKTNGKKYVLSGKTDAETNAIYEQLITNLSSK
ncbi:DUF5808 domain-containing protein [Anaerosporobacter faecicola]|uniref:DUF5808 domain-containing protein n=1 Tax=Anaerosporobacter faecicola TaxID=2718714 RepID=UPI00143BF211|nr:DUF5808 domain-containing protein [Anaerosporobacter faecicola]